MSIVAPPSLEDTLAERRGTKRRTELSETVREARDRLISRKGPPPRIELALLSHHAGKFFDGLPIFATLIAAFGLVLGLDAPRQAAAWVGLNLAASGFLVWLILRFEAAHRPLFQVPFWKRSFWAGHLIAGLPWGLALYWPICETCTLVNPDTLRFAALMGAMAIASIVGAALSGVIFAMFLPSAAVLLYRIATESDPVTQAMHGLLLGAIPFFSLVSSRLRNGMVERMRHRAERDELISEIETARIVSDEARRRAEDANIAKSQFLATMSHELRTPLNAILGFSEVISNEILGPVGNDTYKEYVEDIHRSGQHLLDLINEILDLSRVEAGRYTLNEEALDLVRIAEDGIGYIQLKADKKRVVIESQFERGLPLLWGDPRSLRQVVLNLLSNAVKFTPEGGRIICRVGWTAGGGQYVSVIDNGPGIPADEIPVVLSSFGQGSSAIKSAEQGTGLGLPIVQALISLHNGEFELHSAVGKGTEAIAVFPHARVLEVMPAMSDLT